MSRSPSATPSGTETSGPDGNGSARQPHENPDWWLCRAGPGDMTQPDPKQDELINLDRLLHGKVDSGIERKVELEIVEVIENVEPDARMGLRSVDRAPGPRSARRCAACPGGCP